jgi:hypothetical protein
MAVALQTSVLSRTPTTLIPAIERQLYGNQRTQLNRLNGACTTGASLMTLGFDLDGVRAGAYAEVDSELVFVWSTSGQTATIQRAMLGTTAANHADLSVVRVEPRFLQAEMLDEIVKEIRSWPSNIYRRYVGSLSIAASVKAIDLEGLTGVTGASLGRLQVSPETAREETWVRADYARLERRQDSTSFPSGYGLILPGDLPNARTLQVMVKVPYSDITLGATADFGSIGLTNDLVDIIPWGVVGRLLMTRDVARTDANAQGRSRPAEEVRSGEAVQVGRAMLDMRNQLLVEASNRLLAEDGMGWA